MRMTPEDLAARLHSADVVRRRLRLATKELAAMGRIILHLRARSAVIDSVNASGARTSRPR